MSPVTGSILVLIVCYVGPSATIAPVTELAKPNLLHLPEESRPVQKAGICPADVDYPKCEEAMINGKSECKRDQDCEGKKKCCISGCRKRCLLPVEAKMNSCPYFDHSACVRIRPSPSECHTDDQCQGTDRCCCSNCRRQCKPTVKVTPGECPAVKQACPKILPLPMCQTDNDCKENKKCCDSCGKKCVTPQKEHPGFCPHSSEDISCITLIKSLCTLDSDCPKGNKCCLSGDIRQCQEAIKEKHGACPGTIARCIWPPPPPLCKGDGDCPGDKKCCTPVCRQECTDPIIIKPGKCPVVNTFAPCPTTYSPPLCSSDIHCLGSQKCCDYACRQQCAEPVFK